jgi:aspartyl-tRNA synthetase
MLAKRRACPDGFTVSAITAGLLFIDLRDHYGITQCVVDPDSSAFNLAETVRSEWCIRIDGDVKKRTEETINPELPTGEIEIFIRDMEILGPPRNCRCRSSASWSTRKRCA